MKIIIPALCLALLAIACSDAMSPDDYGHTWREAVAQYRKIDKNPDDVAADPNGVADGSVEARMRAADNISNQIRQIATSMKDLKAPPQFAQLQDETYLFYRGQADDYAGYSEALGTGNPDRVSEAVSRINRYVGEHEQTVSKVIDGLGNDTVRFRASWDTVMKDIPTTTN